MRFIGQKALVLAKMAVALANTTFGEGIGTDPCFFLFLAATERRSSMLKN
jgi:hypothetical protein